MGSVIRRVSVSRRRQVSVVDGAGDGPVRRSANRYSVLVAGSRVDPVAVVIEAAEWDR